jgi:hypothetical protein
VFVAVTNCYCQHEAGQQVVTLALSSSMHIIHTVIDITVSQESIMSSPWLPRLEATDTKLLPCSCCLQDWAALRCTSSMAWASLAVRI